MMTKTTKGVVVEAPSIAFQGTTDVQSYLSVKSRFAKHWLGDALREAENETENAAHHRRREIVFAVNAAESYLIEWVADQLPSSSYADLSEKLLNYLPKPQPGLPQKIGKETLAHLEAARLSAASRDSEGCLASIEQAIAQMKNIKIPNLVGAWDGIPKQLADDGHISSVATGRKQTPQRAAFKKLVDHRNDIVHAGLSWPRGLSFDPNDAREPRTTTETLVNLKAGWATEVVLARIQQLHDETGTSIPQWVNDIQESTLRKRMAGSN